MLVNCEVLSYVSALLPSKTEIAYEQFFTTVCNTVRNNNGNDPDGFLVDFEIAAINAYLKCFTADGCIRLFFPCFIEAYPTCWIKGT